MGPMGATPADPGPEPNAPQPGDPATGAGASDEAVSTGAAGPGEATPATEAVAHGQPAAAVATTAKTRRFSRIRRYVHFPRSRRGFFALLIVVGGMGAAFVFTC